MSNFTIIEFKPNHHKQVLQLLEKTFLEIGFAFDLSSKDSDLNNINDNYFKDRSKFWVLIENQNVIGTIALKKFDKNIYEVKRFFIDKDCRGKGYGNLALEHVVNYSKNNKINTLRLDVDNTLSSALHLYQKFGFSEIEPYQKSDIETLRYFELTL